MQSLPMTATERRAYDLALQIGERVECRVFGTWLWLELVAVDRDGTNALVKSHGDEIVPLRIVAADELRYHDSAIGA